MSEAKELSKILRVIIIFIVAFVVYKCVTEPTTERASDPYLDAYVAAKIEVKKYLKAPSTAKFEDYNRYAVSRINDNTYTVRGYVDAQNSFGAMLRSNFIVKLKGSDTKWEIETLVLDDKRLK